MLPEDINLACHNLVMLRLSNLAEEEIPVKDLQNDELADNYEALFDEFHELLSPTKPETAKKKLHIECHFKEPTE